VDADQSETRGLLRFASAAGGVSPGLWVLLHDLVRDPHEGAAQVVAVEDHPVGRLVLHARPFLASLDRVKGTDAASLAAASARSARRQPTFRASCVMILV
jgi:hypothetical protein